MAAVSEKCIGDVPVTVQGSMWHSLWLAALSCMWVTTSYHLLPSLLRERDGVRVGFVFSNIRFPW